MTRTIGRPRKYRRKWRGSPKLHGIICQCGRRLHVYEQGVNCDSDGCKDLHDFHYGPCPMRSGSRSCGYEDYIPPRCPDKGDEE